MNEAIHHRVMLLNPWQRDPTLYAASVRAEMPPQLIPRSVDLAGFDDSHKAKLVVGPRQAGKSTFIWDLLRSREPEGVLYLSCEEPLVREWATSAVQVVSDLERRFPTVRTLFLEEAQNLEEAGLFVKGLVDAHRDLDILVTGSASYDLQARTRESLAGRAVRRRILPLGFGEVLAYEPSPTDAGQRTRASEILRKQLLFGSYPGVWFAPDPVRALSDLVEAFIVRDASDRFRIRLTSEFRRLLRLAAGQVGQMVNTSEWAGILGVSAPTVQEWLALLEECWVLCQLPPFAGGKRIEVTGARRIHFFDLGVRNLLLGQLGPDVEGRPDVGALAEGWAFAEISKVLPFLWTLHYWRTKGGAEIDFVLNFGERIIGVEIKAGSHRGLSRSARAFVDAYQPEAVIVAIGSDGEEDTMRIERTEVVFVPLHGLPAAVGRRIAA